MQCVVQGAEAAGVVDMHGDEAASAADMPGEQAEGVVDAEHAEEAAGKGDAAVAEADMQIDIAGQVQVVQCGKDAGGVVAQVDISHDEHTSTGKSRAYRGRVVLAAGAEATEQDTMGAEPQWGRQQVRVPGGE